MICSIDGCERPVRARGWCAAHYEKSRRLGDPIAGSITYRSARDAFTNRTVRAGDCLVWTGYVDHGGYGAIKYGPRMQKAHRVAWELVNGPIPVGSFIDHICHNRACVNVEHLRIASRAQNNSHLRGARKDNASTGVRNVYRDGNGYEVIVQANKMRHRIGRFHDLDAARQAAAEARDKLFGAFAGEG